MLPRTLSEYFAQFRQTMAVYPRTGKFFKQHRLWEGDWDYRWISRVLALIAIVVGFKMLSIFSNWWSKAHFDSFSETVSQMGALAGDIFKNGFGLVYASGLKYLMFFLLYAATAHVIIRTLAILSGRAAQVVTFQTVLDSQIRAFKVYIRCWILELLIASIMLSIFFGIFRPIAFLETPAVFLVSCYFVGFAVVDGYNELFGLNVKESMRYSRNYIGIAVATGMVAQLLMAIPVFGPILMPFISGIATTIAMYELSDLHLLERELAVQLDEAVDG